MKEKRQGRNFWTVIGIFAFLIILQVIVLSACSTTTDTGSNDNQSITPAQPQETTDASKASGQATEQLASSCATGCHEMAPEVATWQLSSHSAFDCTVCHVVDKKDMQDKHDSGDYKKPINLKNLISRDVCMKCHSKNREATPSGDLKIPHLKHDAKGIACVNCHAGIVHAKVTERHIVNQKDYDDYSKWTPTLAKKIATDYYYQPDMWTCITCHKALNVTTKCSVCHKAIPSLPSHDQAAWKDKHGISARQNIGQCTQCHSKPDVPRKLELSTGDPAADFARLNDFCYNCHTKKPDFHTDNMHADHPSFAVERGVQNCLTCHDTEQPKPTENVTGTYCNQCHWFTKKQN
ncbi:MAG: cytochrome c3 family protein [Bacillota bacterium]